MALQQNQYSTDDLTCIFCNKLFTKWSHLKYHLEQHVIKVKNESKQILLSLQNITNLTQFSKPYVLSNSSPSTARSDIVSEAKKLLVKLDHEDVDSSQTLHKNNLPILSYSSNHRVNQFNNRNIINEHSKNITLVQSDLRIINSELPAALSLRYSHENSLQLNDEDYSVNYNNNPTNTTNDNIEQNIVEEENIDDPQPVPYQNKKQLSVLIHDNINRNDHKAIAKPIKLGLDENSSKCRVCQRNFKTKGHLATHMKFKHNEKQVTTTTNTCPVCDKKFSSKTNLNTHTKLHSGVRPYNCTICNKSFTTKGTLDSHLLYHSGERRFVCDVCGARFYTSFTLGRHQKLHSGERLFQCSDCNSSYVTISDLNRHKLSHQKIKPFPCDYCTKSFYRKHDLKVHLKYHSATMEYRCEYCSREFVEISSYNRHIRQHTGIKPYKCVICGINFTQLHHLKKHTSTSHPGELRNNLSNSQRKIILIQKERIGHLQKQLIL